RDLEGESVGKVYDEYAALRSKYRYMQARPGSLIPFPQMDVRVVTSAAETIHSPLPRPRAGSINELCSQFTPQTEDSYAVDRKAENAASVGIVVQYGRFSFADFSDLTWNQEPELVCPRNLIGSVDVYVTTTHGMSMSGSPVFVHALRPRVAIWNN